VAFCSLHGFQCNIGSRGGKSTKYPTGVEPARPLLSKNFIPIDVAGLELGNRGVSAIVGSDRGPHSESALSEIEAISCRVTHPVVLNPTHQRLIDSSLVDEILKQSSHRIIGERADERGVHTKAALQSASYVVFSAALGYQVPGMDEHHSTFEVDGFKKMIGKVVKDYPFSVVATTLRKAKTATQNDWGAICYCDGKFYQAKNRENLEICDRVCGGDSFASGLIYGFLSGKDPQWAVECGAAHGALAMTTPGDTSMATLQEVIQVMEGVGARIAR